MPPKLTFPIANPWPRCEVAPVNELVPMNGFGPNCDDMLKESENNADSLSSEEVKRGVINP